MAATGGAVALSWFGVHAVLSGTAYDPPRALPITAEDAVGPLSESLSPSPSASPSVGPTASSTQRPSPSKSAGSKAPPPKDTAPKPPESPPKRQPAPTPSDVPQQDTGRVHSYSVEGGRVAFDQGPDSATLVSATPNSGWEMQVWEQPYWIRVDFSRGDLTWSVFCVWNGHPPRVDTYKDQR